MNRKRAGVLSSSRPFDRDSTRHYTYLYYSQVMYRQGAKDWEPFRDKIYNLIMLQLDKGFLPIYQR